MAAYSQALISRTGRFCVVPVALLLGKFDKFALQGSFTMAPGPRKSVFIISHPRSGTHLLIDFIRRNFPNYDRKLKPWQSSSHIYIGLDRPNWRNQLATRLNGLDATHFLLQSHYAGIVHACDREAKDMLTPTEAVFLYPFRLFSTTLKSYAEFRKFDGSIGAFLGQTDDFFGLGVTVEQCIRLHAAKWLEYHIHAVDIDRLSAAPDMTVRRLAELLGDSPAKRSRRLPRRRLFSGRLGEITERLCGRESSEFVVDHEIQWQNSAERAAIDEQFAGLYGELCAQRIN